MQGKDGKRRKEKTIIMFEDMEFDTATIIGIIGGIAGGVFAWMMAESMMPGNFLIKTATFLVTAVVCFFVAQKIISQ